MSRADLRAIDTLLRVKQRRLEQARAEVKACTQTLREREAERDETQEAHDACRADESACQDRIDAMCRGGFLPDEFVLRQRVLQGLRELTQQAAKAVEAAEAQVAQARQMLKEARRVVQRAEALIKFLQERREQVLRDIEQQQLELQDEESEEAAVARQLAAAAAAETAA
jgi:hypothetical protein